MKKKIVITLSIIVLILLVTLGTSVALFSYLSKGTIENSIELGDLTFHYTEISGVGNGINITDAEPISDEEGKTLDNYFDFKIDANLIQSDLIYEVVVEEIEGSSLPLDIVKFYLTEIVDNEEVK